VTVWIVYDWDWEDRWVVGVYSTRDKADVKSAEIKGLVEEWTLDGARVEP